MPRRIGHELDVGRLQVGTRQALADKGRHSLTVTLSELSARMLGVLIALFERTVGYYAKLIHANACHQPGVESGKRAAAQILALQKRLLSALSDEPKTATELCARSDAPKDHFAAQFGDSWVQNVFCRRRAKLIPEDRGRAPGRDAPCFSCRQLERRW